MGKRNDRYFPFRVFFRVNFFPIFRSATVESKNFPFRAIPRNSAECGIRNAENENGIPKTEFPRGNSAIFGTIFCQIFFFQFFFLIFFFQFFIGFRWKMDGSNGTRENSSSLRTLTSLFLPIKKVFFFLPIKLKFMAAVNGRFHWENSE